jgi:tRNA A37 threonylcarbamoyltransferase TsaD
MWYDQVVSGGVASNTYLRSGLERLCDNYGYKLVCPPHRLCTDNGVMIAWWVILVILFDLHCLDIFGTERQCIVRQNMACH